MLVRAETRVIACPVPHTFRESPNDMEFSGERKRVRCNEVLAAVADVPMEEPFARAVGIYFSGTGLISKRPEDIRANTHSAPLAHFAECAVLAGISE